MDELISRKEVLKIIQDEKDYSDSVYATSVCMTIEKAVGELPSIKPRKWRWNFIGNNMFECTCCNVPYTTEQLNGLRNYDTDPYVPKFCPNCGSYNGG